jgi:hypothetical protein
MKFTLFDTDFHYFNKQSYHEYYSDNEIYFDRHNFSFLNNQSFPENYSGDEIALFVLTPYDLSHPDPQQLFRLKIVLSYRLFSESL